MKMTEEQKALAENNVRLVYFIAKKFWVPSGHFDDVTQNGMIGLCQAAQRFNPELGWEFATYASKMIYGHMQRYIREFYLNYQGVKFSRDSKNNRSRFANYILDNPGVTMREIQEELGISEDTVNELTAYIHSYDDTQPNNQDEGDLSFEGTIGEDDPSLDEFLTVEKVADVLRFMEEKYSKGSAAWYVFEEFIWDEVYGGTHGINTYYANKYGISQSYVSRILNKYGKIFVDLYKNDTILSVKEKV